MPNLHELGALKLEPLRWDAERFFRNILEQLAPLHAHLIFHNKIRRDNVYWDQHHSQYVLAWLGTEPSPSLPLQQLSEVDLIKCLSGALNRWATAQTRQMFAVRYIETQSPEVMRGEPASVASDLYAVAAIAVLGTQSAAATVDDSRRLQQEWAHGHFGYRGSMMSASLATVLQRCLQLNPQERPATVAEVLRGLAES